METISEWYARMLASQEREKWREQDTEQEREVERERMGDNT